MSKSLRLDNISHGYSQAGARLPVLQNVSLELSAGEAAALCGPSGSGKSTLLHLTGLLEKPNQGRIIINGEVVGDNDGERTRLRRHHIGFVFQFHNLLPEFTAVENVMMPLRLLGEDGAAMRDRARDWLTRLGLENRLEHLPAQLSGGEQQRVAIARALVHQPLVLIADEPTGSLDHETGQAVADILLETCQNLQTIVLIATHNEQLAHRVGRVLRLQDGQLSG